jgi:glucose-induced degradation protein 4
MPTPSSNPPPELPPRSHSSSCPDELRASTSSWRPDQESSLDAMHVDGESTSPDPVSAPPPPRQTLSSASATTSTSSPMAEDVDIESRSNTESPRPESRGGRHAVRQPSAEDAEIDGLSQSGGKARDDTASEHRQSPRNASNQKSAAFDMASPSGTEFDKTEDWMLSSNGIQDDYSALPAGYEFSNVRVRTRCRPSPVYIVLSQFRAARLAHHPS